MNNPTTSKELSLCALITYMGIVLLVAAIDKGSFFSVTGGNI